MRWRAFVAVASTVGCAVGCNLIVGLEQCESDEDCARFEDATNLVCGSENICISTEERTCSHAACAQQGENMICGARGECVKATTPECTLIDGPIDRDPTIIIGTIQPTSGDFTSAGLPQEQGVRLALEEFNESGQTGELRFALIGCDSAGDPQRGLAAAEHLVQDVGVPLIIGPAFSGIFIEVTTSVTVPAGVMTMSGSATSATITDLDDDGLAWRTISSDAFQSVAIADRIRDLRAAGQATKVAAFGKDDPYGKGLLFAVATELEAELGEDSFFSAVYPDVGEGSTASLTQSVADALANNFSDADVVLLLGTSEVAGIVAAYADALAELDNGATPLYVMPDGGKLPETLALVSERPELQQRIEGTVPSLENGSIYSAFDLRFKSKFGDSPQIFAGNSYDAAYLASYALTTLSQRGAALDAIDGTALSEFMGNFVSGREVVAGPGGIRDALTALEAGSSIDYEGVSGPLSFDLERGEASANVDRWIITTDSSGNLEFELSGTYEVDETGRGTWEIPRDSQ